MFQDPQTMQRTAYEVNVERERLERAKDRAQEKAQDEAISTKLPACQGMVDRVNGLISEESKKGNYKGRYIVKDPADKDCASVVAHFLEKAGYRVVFIGNRSRMWFSWKRGELDFIFPTGDD